MPATTDRRRVLPERGGMMDWLRGYFLSLTGASVICAVITALFPGKGASAKLIKLISGVILCLIALQPVSRLDISSFLREWEFDLSSGTDASHDGEILAQKARYKLIKDSCEAYILDKATELGLQITVEIELDDQSFPQPESVVIRGNISPYAKVQLQQILTSDLGIAKENQTWTGQP